MFVTPSLDFAWSIVALLGLVDLQLFGAILAFAVVVSSKRFLNCTLSAFDPFKLYFDSDCDC